MKRTKAQTDPAADEAKVVGGSGSEREGATAETAMGTTQPTYAPYQELLTSWWTTAALAWGTPVKMWSEIVAAAWRPFMPPTALTAENLPHAGPPDNRAAQPTTPLPARPAPQVANRKPRTVAPMRPVPGSTPRPR